MAFTSAFFDAELVGDEYDRVYSAEKFAEYFASFIANGVFPNPSTNLQVVNNIPSNMTVVVKPGLGWINGYYCKNDEEYSLDISPASGTLPRIDAVVIRWSRSDRAMFLEVKTGVADSNPVIPALERSADNYELMLASIYIDAGVTSINQLSITDKRPDSTVCGWVKGTVEQIDTTNLFAQYDNAFQTWFADIQTQLSGDVATNLQNQINTLKSDKVNTSDKASISQAQEGTDDTKWMTPALVKAYADSKLIPTLTDYTSRISSLEAENTLNKKEIASLADSLRRQLISNAYKDIAPPEASAMYVQPFIDTEDISTLTGAFVGDNMLSYNAGKSQGTIDGGSSSGTQLSQYTAIGFRSVGPQTISSVTFSYESGFSSTNTSKVHFELFSATLTDTNKLTLGSMIISKSVSMSFSPGENTVEVSLDMPIESGYHVLVIKTGTLSLKLKYEGNRGDITNLSNGSMVFGTHLDRSYGSGSVCTFVNQFPGSLVFTSRNVSSASVVSKSISMPYEATKALICMEVNTVTGITMELNNASVTTKSEVNTTTVDGVSCILWTLEANLSNLNTLLWSLDLSGNSTILVYSLAVFYI